MGINSRIRVQYWQEATRLLPPNEELYPNGSDIVSEAHVDASRWDAIGAGLEVFLNGVDFGLNAAAGNFIGTAVSGYRLGRSIEDLRASLADKASFGYAAVFLAYPDLRYNRVLIRFEADSDFDTMGRVGHSPEGGGEGSTFQYRSSGDRRDLHHHGEFIINLDQLRNELGNSMWTSLPLSFAFSIREDSARVTDLSALYHVQVFIMKQGEALPNITTDITYMSREPVVSVARRTLMQYVPTAERVEADGGVALEDAVVPIAVERDGSIVIDGKSYQQIGLGFRWESTRKHILGESRAASILANFTPSNASLPAPVVSQPDRSPAHDDRLGEDYLAEGVGTANVSFNPLDVSPGETLVNFLVADAGRPETSCLVSHVVHLDVVYKWRELAPIITTTIIYAKEEGITGFASRRVMQYIPTIDANTPGSGESVQSVGEHIVLASDGSFTFDGKPCDSIQVIFEVDSKREIVGSRPRMELSANTNPLNWRTPTVEQPRVEFQKDEHGRYEIEGHGRIILHFRPSRLEPGTYQIGFGAIQNPGIGRVSQTVRFKVFRIPNPEIFVRTRGTN